MKTPQDQVRGGREEGILPSTAVSMVVSTTCQTIHNSPPHVISRMESGVIGGQHHQRHGKGAWSTAGVIRGSD